MTPDPIATRIRDIRPGDLVDLEGHPYAKGESFIGAEFELFTVCGAELETEDCLRLDFESADSIGFDPDDSLPSVAGVFAEAYA